MLTTSRSRATTLALTVLGVALLVVIVLKMVPSGQSGVLDCVIEEHVSPESGTVAPMPNCQP